MLASLLHTLHGQLILALTLVLLGALLWLARRPRGEELPLTVWLGPAALVLGLGAIMGTLELLRVVHLFAGLGSADQLGHAVFALNVADPLRVASGAAAVLLTAATALSSWRREGWRRLTVLATLVALTASASSLYDLLFGFHDGLRSCEAWAPGEIGSYLRGQNQILVAQGALLTCALGATLALAGWALHPESWPSRKESAGVALCLLLGGLPAVGLHQLGAPWLDATLLARVPQFMGVTENLPLAFEGARGPCQIDAVWSWEAGVWRALTEPPEPPQSLELLLALPSGAPAAALLDAPRAQGERDDVYLALHVPDATLALDTALGQLSRIRVLPLLPLVAVTEAELQDSEGGLTLSVEGAPPRALGSLDEVPTELSPLRVLPGPSLSVDALVQLCAPRACQVASP